MSMLSLYALLAWAHDGALDELGCHEDAITDSYHCHQGTLSGREFVTKGEAQDALAAQAAVKAGDLGEESTMTRETDESRPLRVLSWNVEAVGTKRFEYDRIANLLAEYDIVALQGVEFSKSGETSLTVITGLMRRKLNEKVCKAWFKNSAGQRGRHAFLWRETRVSLLEKSGEIRESCTDAPHVFAVAGKKFDADAPMQSTFVFRPKRQMFTIASVQRAKKAKSTLSIFKSLNAPVWPMIVAGDIKAPAKDKSFAGIRKLGFKSAIEGGTNVWTKNLGVVRGEKIDLQDRFPELTAAEIESGVAGYSPISIDVTFSIEEADALKTELIKKPARDKSSVQILPPVPEPAMEPMNVHDDLESEVE